VGGLTEPVGEVVDAAGVDKEAYGKNDSSKKTCLDMINL
jgi:hypothetical protein